MNTQELIKEMNSGKIFTAEFIKKDGSRRQMNCRTNVKKYVTGKCLSFNPTAKSLLPVFDLKKKQYRFINLSTLISVTIKQKKYFINDLIIDESIEEIDRINKTLSR